jgi:hypothetical protein
LGPYTPSGVAAPAQLSDLADARFKKIALANPDHAPYGVAAKQALEKAGVWPKIEGRIVLAENVLATMLYALDRNACGPDLPLRPSAAQGRLRPCIPADPTEMVHQLGPAQPRPDRVRTSIVAVRSESTLPSFNGQVAFARRSGPPHPERRSPSTLPRARFSGTPSRDTF